LKELDLGYNKGITSLAAVDFSKLAGSLVKLNLESLDITNKDVANIAKLSGLRELSISRSGINDKGLKELLPKLDKLEVLNISNDARRITPKSAALIYALLEKGTLKKVTCFNFGDKWRRAFSNLELLQSGKHEHLTGLIKDEIAKIFAENPDMQRELDEARALLKAPTPNTHEGGAKIGVEKGKGR
jgi:Leucine-rich repeat (LRR) protein